MVRHDSNHSRAFESDLIFRFFLVRMTFCGHLRVFSNDSRFSHNDSRLERGIDYLHSPFISTMMYYMDDDKLAKYQSQVKKRKTCRLVCFISLMAASALAGFVLTGSDS